MGAVEIAAALAASRKAVLLYPPEHPTHREALAGLCKEVTEAVDVRPLVLNLRDGRLYEGSEVLTEASPATRALAEAMEVRRVESLTFHMGFNETDGEGISDVLSLRPSPDLQVQAELEARAVRAVTVSELEDNLSREAEERDKRREADRSLYRQTLAALKRDAAAFEEEDESVVESVEVARVVAEIMERVAEDPHAILSLATMTGHGERWMFHAIGVMLTALVLGHGAGLSDRQLLSLGLAALMHDIGSAIAPESDAEAIGDAHPVVGAHALGALRDEDCASMIVAYEHHMGVDGSGWPAHGTDHVPHPFSRIVAIADRYDNLIRPAEGRALRPDEAAVQLLREASQGPLDADLARLFVQIQGVMPVGCIVRLSDHSVGIVRGPGEDPLRPHLRLILAADGSEMRPSLDIELAEDERAVVEVIPWDVLGLQPSDYL